jgi:hypothetical protein
MSNLPHDIARASKDIQDHYRKMIADGQSPMFSEMCALQQAPATRGMDRTLMEGRYDGSWLDKLPKKQADRMIREARSAGISTSGRFYMSGLADKRGHLDPMAWIDSTDDIKRVAKVRNLEVNGIVNVTAEPTPPKRIPLNPKIVEKLSKDMMAKDPKLSKRDAVEAVKDKHTPGWHKKSRK